MKRKNTEEKTLRKLERKREKLAEYLRLRNIEIIDRDSDHAVLSAAYRFCGRTYEKKHRTSAGFHAHYANVYRWLHHIGRVSNKCVNEKKVKKQFTKTEWLFTEKKLKRFYSSYEWRKVRYAALVRDGGQCQACGRTKDDNIVLNVDHIKPLRYNWELRLDLDNLQTLCNVCNHGKGNWDQTNWRKDPGILWLKMRCWSDAEIRQFSGGVR